MKIWLKAILFFLFFSCLFFKLEIMAFSGDISAKSILAAKNEDIYVLRNILNSSNSINSKFGNHGWTLLHYSVDASKPENVILLIKNGSDVNAKAHPGEMVITPFHIAVIKESRSMATLLLENGADISIPMGNGEPIIKYACRTNKSAITDLIGGCP